MKKVLSIFSLLLIILLVSGCNLEIYSEAYLSDIYAFLANPLSDLSIFSTIKLEIMAESTFKEQKNKITEVLKDYFGEVKNVRYEGSNFKSYYVADFELPVISELRDEGMLYLSADKNGNMLFLFNNEIFEELNKRILNEFYQSLDLKDMYINITLINDLRREIDIEVQGVYVNYKPCPYIEKFKLKNREKVIISFSNVLRDYMVENGRAVFAKIYW